MKTGPRIAGWLRTSSPADLVSRLETDPVLPSGNGDRFTGYAIMSCPFASGHILAMRRFPATSTGPGYTSVWHRDPDGRWTFFQDQPVTSGCSRYFGPALDRTVHTDIDIDWTGPNQFSVRIEGESTLDWRISLRSTRSTRLLNCSGAILPRSWWASSPFLKAMGSIAAAMLRSGRLQLAGRAPDGRHFLANPRWLSMISDSTALLDGQDFGPPGPAGRQTRLGDFWIPTRGLFAIGDAFFEDRVAG